MKTKPGQHMHFNFPTIWDTDWVFRHFDTNEDDLFGSGSGGDNDPEPIDPEPEPDPEPGDPPVDPDPEPEPEEDEYFEFEEQPIYNGEPLKVKKSELKTIVQKGANYERLQGKLTEAESQIKQISDMTGLSVDQVISNLQQLKKTRDARDLAANEGISEEDAALRLEVQELRREVTTDRQMRGAQTTMQQELDSLKNKPFFEELKPRLQAAIDESITNSQPISVVDAYKWLIGENYDELVKQTKDKATKRTVANIQDRAKRGAVKPDAGSEDGVVDTSDVDHEMASAFGNKPSAIAKHKKKFRKRK